MNGRRTQLTDQIPVPHADIELARKLERTEGAANAAFVSARARIEPGSGATWTEIAGVYAMFDGAESPLTQTFGLGLFDEVVKTSWLNSSSSFAKRVLPFITRRRRSSPRTCSPCSLHEIIGPSSSQRS